MAASIETPRHMPLAEKGVRGKGQVRAAAFCHAGNTYAKRARFSVNTSADRVQASGELVEKSGQVSYFETYNVGHNFSVSCADFLDQAGGTGSETRQCIFDCQARTIGSTQLRALEKRGGSSDKSLQGSHGMSTCIRGKLASLSSLQQSYIVVVRAARIIVKDLKNLD